MSEAALPYDQVVFSGGGIRCFWHGGWVTTVTEHHPLRPDRIIGVSGGALSAAAWIAGTERRLLDVMCDAFADEDANVSWHDLNKEDGLTPHQRVYCEVVETVIDAEAQERISGGPAFQVFLARPPDNLLTDLLSWLGGSAYELEKSFASRSQSQWSPRFGLKGEHVDARAAARDGRLAELVTIAATIPPVFRIQDWDGAPAIDGGMVDQSPMPEPDEGPTLVLLTRTYDDLPIAEARDFVEPSEPVVDHKIDFTEPAKLHQAWRLGENDAAAWLEQRRGPTGEET
ncbi:patatin-like phospholipase family protein [Aestuariibius sp. 2305UL40-4]|uniref:patatin-like phospholipase family protein n=1 Tax=Aestuariibius violaceus TaxID=3234132 RepID=UPI00345F0F19